MAKRGGFPGGMPGNMNNLMKQAQKMQKQMEENVEMLEDLIRAATNEALRKVEDEAAKAMGKLAGGLGSMGGGFPF